MSCRRRHLFEKVLVRWAKGKRLTNRLLPNISLITPKIDLPYFRNISCSPEGNPSIITLLSSPLNGGIFGTDGYTGTVYGGRTLTYVRCFNAPIKSERGTSIMLYVFGDTRAKKRFHSKKKRNVRSEIILCFELVSSTTPTV